MERRVFSAKRARDEDDEDDDLFVTQLRRAQRSRVYSDDGGIVKSQDGFTRAASPAPRTYGSAHDHKQSYGRSSMSLVDRRWWMGASFEPEPAPDSGLRYGSERSSQPSIGFPRSTIHQEAQKIPASESIRNSIYTNTFSSVGSISTRRPSPPRWEEEIDDGWQFNRRGSAKSSTSDVSTVIDSPTSSTQSPLPTPAPRIVPKTSRYLREMDRHHILQRLKDGETQAVLAKEYQVSRAAICMLHKHRDVVLSREVANPLSNHPLKTWPKDGRAPQKATMIRARDRGDPRASVHEIPTRAVAILMTALLDTTTSRDDFRRLANRLGRVVVEEALALVPLPNPEDTATSVNVEPVHGACGIVMETSGSSLLLQLFRELEPRQPTGSIHVTCGLTAQVKLPGRIAEQNIFLFDLVMISPTETCVAISSLIARGASEERLCLVTLCISDAVACVILKRFPDIQIVTASKDQDTKSHRFLINQFVQNIEFARGLP